MATRLSVYRRAGVTAGIFMTLLLGFIQPPTALGSVSPDLAGVAAVFCIPTTGTMSSGFGPRPEDYHYGMDIAGVSENPGNAIYAPYAGTVTYVVGDGFPYPFETNPHIVAIDHGWIAAKQKYVMSTYAHMGSHRDSSPYQDYINVSQGQSVQKGTLLGYQGQAGNAFGTHLHWEVREKDTPGFTHPWDGTALDPQQYAGAISGYVEETCSNSTPPAGAIATPAQNATVAGVVRISGQATASNATINLIQIFIDGTLRSQVGVAGNNWFWDWATTSEPDKTYAVKVKAFDSSGQSAWLKAPGGSDTLTIRLDNPAQIIPQASNCLKPLLRYWNQSRQKHFYTANPAEYGSPGRDGWVYEGYIGFVAKDATCHIPNAIPLYRFWSTSRNKHFYTTNYAEGTAANFDYHGIEGYVSPSSNSQYHTKPIKRFFRLAIDNHYYTDNMAEAPGDYNDEGIKFYVFTLVNKAPNKPTLAAPAHNSARVNKTLALSWNDAGDVDAYPRNFRDYEATIRKGGGTWTQPRAKNNSASWNVTVPETGQYCWKVRSYDGQTFSDWTAERCLNVYPTVKAVVDSPVNNATLAHGLTYRLSGWSIQQETPSGTGIDKIHVYLDGPAGSGQLLGAASYGQERSDIARIYGERYRWSGFSYSWNTSNVSVGPHTLYIYANSTVTGWSSMTRTVNVVAAKRIFIPFVRK